MADFSGKTVLITGGTTGIGFAAAKLFYDEGATVLVTGRNEGSLEAARSELGDRVEVIESDASDPAAIEKLFGYIEEKHGGLDALFLNAGIAKPFPIEMAEPGLIEQLFAVNVTGPILAVKHAAGLLREGSSIVITTSVVNQLGMAGFSVYGATKGAVLSFVRSAAAELAPRGIRVNAVSPGPVETPIWGKMDMPAAELEAAAEGVRGMISLGRMGRADEIARAAVFLSGSDASFITGEELVVDGGTVL